MDAMHMEQSDAAFTGMTLRPAIPMFNTPLPDEHHRAPRIDKGMAREPRAPDASAAHGGDDDADIDDDDGDNEFDPPELSDESDEVDDATSIASSVHVDDDPIDVAIAAKEARRHRGQTAHDNFVAIQPMLLSATIDRAGHGFLPTCARCHNSANPDGSWVNNLRFRCLQCCANTVVCDVRGTIRSRA